MREKTERSKKIRSVIYIVLAIVNIVYGIVVRAVHSEHISFVLWIAIGIFFIVCWLFCRYDLMKRMPRVLAVVIAAILIIGLVFFIVAEANVASRFESDAPKGVDYVIVLGCGIDGSRPSPSLKYRLDTAYDYLKENEDTVCILSGGKGEDEEYSEAEVMYEYIVDKGLEDERIILEDKSLDTIQNIENSKKLLPSPDASVALCTSNFHMYRACLIAEREGLTDVYGISAPSPAFFVPHNMIKEVISLAVLQIS